MEVRRGDIYIVKRINQVGSEQEGGRPAVIVSNDTGNKFGTTVEIVWLTASSKKTMPTHADVMCKVPSTALCEQITTVSKERLIRYVRTCTDEEMNDIDDALITSLGLTKDVPSDLVEKYKSEASIYKKLYEELLNMAVG